MTEDPTKAVYRAWILVNAADPEAAACEIYRIQGSYHKDFVIRADVVNIVNGTFNVVAAVTATTEEGFDEIVGKIQEFTEDEVVVAKVKTHNPHPASKASGYLTLEEDPTSNPGRKLYTDNPWG